MGSVDPIRQLPGPFDGGDQRSPSLPNTCPRCEGRRRIEVFSSGFDEFLQMQGGDPYGGTSGVGLRVPFLPTPPAGGAGAPLEFGPNTSGLDLRYMFNLASFSVAEGAKARIIGFRQLLTIGCKITPTSITASSIPTFAELEVTSPVFGFTDARQPSWHLRIIGPNQVPRARLATAAQAGSQSFALQMSDGPALLYALATTPTPNYPALTAYVPPNRGRPWGVPVNANLGTFFDLRTKWRTASAWESLDIPVSGPAQIAFFASVRQTAPSTRPVIPTPSTFFPNGLSPEDQFVKNFSTDNAPSGTTYGGAVWWRVGGALILELDK